MSARLATYVWIGAYLRRLQQRAIPAYVVAKGNPVAGAIQVKLSFGDGRAALWGRVFDPSRERHVWLKLGEGPEAEIDSRITRDRARDRDLWVLEVEDPKGRHLLETLDGEA